MLYTTAYCQMQRISLPNGGKIHTRYGMHFSAILSNYNGMTAGICRPFILTVVMPVTHAPETGAGFWSVCHGH